MGPDGSAGAGEGTDTRGRAGVGDATAATPPVGEQARGRAGASDTVAATPHASSNAGEDGSAGVGAGSGATDTAVAAPPVLADTCSTFVDQACGNHFEGSTVQYSDCFMCLQDNVIGLIKAECPSEVAWICDHMFDIGLTHERDGKEFAEEFFAIGFQAQLEETKSSANNSNNHRRSFTLATSAGVAFVGTIALLGALYRRKREALSNSEAAAVQAVPALPTLSLTISPDLL